MTVKDLNKTDSFSNFTSGISNYSSIYAQDINSKSFFGFPTASILESENNLLSNKTKSTAYFSMEYGLTPSIYNRFDQSRDIDKTNMVRSRQVFSNNWTSDEQYNITVDRILDIPIYGGGLGVLAGDTLKASADLKFSVVGIGILWNKGYFKQKFVHQQGQQAEQVMWDPESYPGLIPLNKTVTIETREGPLHLKLWKYYIFSHDHSSCTPLILIDSNLAQNSKQFQKLTDQLYRSDDEWWRIFQRSILGIGGIKVLNEMGYHIDCFHLNEGHAAFALVEKYLSLENKSDFDEIKKKFVFTCHTPIAAGHDRFLVSDLGKVLGDDYIEAAKLLGRENKKNDVVNLTYMALSNCRKVNAVAKKHGEIMHIQFPNYIDKINSITNGIHIHTWISDSFHDLFDQYQDAFTDWRHQPSQLANIESLRDNEMFRQDLWEAHQANKRNLVNALKEWGFKENVYTIAWARRITGYKRPALLLHKIDRLIELSKTAGPMQIIMAGKAHPCDDVGAARIDDILSNIDQLKEYRENIKIVILGNYDTYLGKILTNSVDVWLNNPLPPFEASGTSGMKATLNGVPQLSTLDGWIVEASREDIGWIFGYQHSGRELGDENQLRLDQDSKELYLTLKKSMDLYYNTYKDGSISVRSQWIDKMINCIKVSAFFNTKRMVEEYKESMWE